MVYLKRRHCLLGALVLLCSNVSASGGSVMLTKTTAGDKQDSHILLSGQSVVHSNHIRLARGTVNSNLHVLTQRLVQYRSLAKKGYDLSYAGVALSMIDALDDTIKKRPEILSLHADLLQFTHHFDEAIAIYEQLSDIDTHVHHAAIALLPLYMMSGQYDKANANCQRLKQHSVYLVGMLCQLWVSGVTDNLAHSIAQLERLLPILKRNSQAPVESGLSIAQWAQEITIDLLLQSGQFTKALNMFDNQQQQQSPEDAALAKLSIDFLLLTHNTSLITSLPDNITPNHPLYLRIIIVRLLQNPLADNVLTLKRKGDNIVQRYRQLGHHDKLMEVALWQHLIQHDTAAAAVSAQKNWQTNRYITDALLLKVTNENNNEKIVNLISEWKQRHDIQTVLL